MSFLEGLYLVALASVFALIPSGPGYAGTQDAAAVIGIKAIGGTGATAVSYLVMLRFALLVPITVAGLLLLVFRYGGLFAAGAGRSAREAAPEPRGHRLQRARRAGARPAPVRPRRPPLPPRREPGRLLLLDPLQGRRLRLQPVAARAAALLPDGDDVLAVRRLGLHGAPRAGADGHLDGRDAVLPAPPARPRRRLHGRRAARDRPVATCTSRASPARTSTSRRSASRCSWWCSASSTSRGAGIRR